MKKLDVGTVTRTILIIIAFINQGLVVFGKNTLPFTNNQIIQVIAFVFTAVTSITAWWKNNSFTAEAKIADKVLKDLKKRNKTTI